MRNLRCFLPHHAYLVTSRTREGLPFVPVEFMNMLICSTLARAQRLYAVKLIALTMEANHFHMIISVVDPEEASAFVGYFKAETAHHLNRLRGRHGQSVWDDRFDSPIILDYPKLLEKFAYVMLNPVKDGLVRSIDDYPGLCSYKYLQDGINDVPVKLVPKSAVLPLKDPTQPFKENASQVEYFSSDKFKGGVLKFEPEVLREIFPEIEHLSPAELRQFLLSHVKSAEAAFQEERGKSSVIGTYRLTRASILKPHTPPRTGARMICLSTCRELRKGFITQFRELCRRCREVFERWKLGYLDEPFPPGMFAPALPRRANLLPEMIV